MTYEDCLKLTADKWNSLDVDTKVEILNTLEAHEAEVNSRIACPVEGRFLYTGNDGIVMGQYTVILARFTLTIASLPQTLNTGQALIEY